MLTSVFEVQSLSGVLCFLDLMEKRPFNALFCPASATAMPANSEESTNGACEVIAFAKIILQIVAKSKSLVDKRKIGYFQLSLAVR